MACRPAIARGEALPGLPALQGARIDAGDLAGRLQARSSGVGRVDVLGQGLAIFEADHSSSPLLKIAPTFLRNGLNRLKFEAELRRAPM